ncbi:hypothetical protein [Micromonospora mirobrigensis]|uniref:Uncharacterized protein n=1 Tax=Micromonospora mirobrigensis TaxID=262898 RepID=A0A1C4WEV4_9ACTN|nr:hypothetical protein [Micromonospora mirobrigensis]SCE94700.1 hypothetical protein GA0070564_102213 [Micromonospora mirobrigensis]
MAAIPFRIPRPRPGRLVLPLLVLALVAVSIVRFGGYAAARPGYAVPHDGQLEAALGVRFTQAAVVGDGGLVELRYLVLDTQKASAFQNDTKHPPRLRNERSGKLAWRAALMKQGHELRPGQSYYLLYLNNGGAVRRGDTIEITSGQRRLAHVPVR